MERKSTGMGAVVLYLFLLAITLKPWIKDLIPLEGFLQLHKKEFD